MKKSKIENLEENIFDMTTLFKELEKNQNIENSRYFQKKSDLEENSVVVKIVNTMLLKAIKEKVSDIHIESCKEYIRIRYRVDGVLIEVGKIKGTIFLQYIISRIKIMADLDIVERRMPQDGWFELDICLLYTSPSPRD